MMYPWRDYWKTRELRNMKHCRAFGHEFSGEHCRECNRRHRVAYYWRKALERYWHTGDGAGHLNSDTDTILDHTPLERAGPPITMYGKYEDCKATAHEDRLKVS